jgi:hypothetical protein
VDQLLTPRQFIAYDCTRKKAGHPFKVTQFIDETKLVIHAALQEALNESLVGYQMSGKAPPLKHRR